VVDSLIGKTLRAAREKKFRTVVVSGGVAANTRLRRKMTARGRKEGIRVLFPSPSLCTDNAAMIAGAAFHQFKREDFSNYSFRPSAKMKTR